MTRWIGIALGDITGIGPEVALKAIAAESQNDPTRFLLIGDANHTRKLNQQLGLDLPLQTYGGKDDAGRFFICNPLIEPLTENLTPGSPAAANAALAWLREGAERCLRQELDALVTAPVNKLSIAQAGNHGFVGQTEFLSDLAGTNRTAMMLLGQDESARWLRVVLATTHVALKSVSANLTQEKVELAIELAVRSCKQLRLPRARIGVCGLNPHAGEGGEFGDEEITTIDPAVAGLREKGFDVLGPLPADTLFHSAYRGKFDVVVAMYHDQGLAPLKMVAFESGVNWTLGLPFIRTSPDHGTAHDIAGQNQANPSSMIAAIGLAKQLAQAS